MSPRSHLLADPARLACARHSGTAPLWLLILGIATQGLIAQGCAATTGSGARAGQESAESEGADNESADNESADNESAAEHTSEDPVSDSATAIVEANTADAPETQGPVLAPESPAPGDEGVGGESAPTVEPAIAAATLSAGEVLALDAEQSLSIGGPRDGRLQGAVALPLSGPGFRSNLRRPNAEAFYGSVELVQALIRAAAVVHEDLPGGELFINDIGFEEGGAIDHHGSHRAGRDVDVLFYLIDREREPRRSVGAFLDPHGRGFDFKDLSVHQDDELVRLDRPRTWRFIQALLEGPHADDIQRIFVAEHIRTLLLAQARRARAPRAIRERFEQISCQPGAPHDDHLHIRFHCSAQDQAEGCQDSPPVYQWRRNQLRALGLRPAISRPRRARRRSRRTSRAQARARAPRMHSRVRLWLERRQAWADQPHPGRPYCR